MVPILRHEPGSIVSADGVYVLVGHYGEATNFSVRLNKGDRLPLITVAADIGPLWFVHMSEANEQARVA